MRERNAADGGNDEKEVNLRARVKRSVDLSKSARQGEEECRRYEADQTKTANRAELRGRTLDEHAVERPAKCGGEGNDQSGQRNMSILSARLEPNHTERADQAENCAGLKLPLTDDVTFLRKKSEREQRGEDDG